MAETQLFDAIERLRYENSQYHTANFFEQEKQTKNTETLNKTVGEFLAEFKGARADSRLDAEEARRDASGGGQPPAADTRPRPDSPNSPDFELKGILATLAGIAAGFAGFVTGIAIGVAKIYGSILKTVAKALKLDVAFKLIKDIGRLLNTKLLNVVNSVKGFIRAATLAFAINFPRITNAILDFGSRIGKIGSSFTDTTGKAVKTLTTSFQNLKNAFLAGTNGIQGLSRSASGTFRQLNVIEKFFRAWGRTTGKISDGAKAIGKLMDTKLLTPFKNLMNGIRGVGQSTSVLGKSLKVLFTGFKTIGRFIAFPLTIIMGIIDGFKGLMAGAERQEGMFNKLLGGAIGAITGVLKGVIAMPLDLLKDGISWIAGKLGFENFSKMLDSFSFSEMFQFVGDNLADNFVRFFSEIGEVLSKSFNSIMEPFKDGFSFGALLEFIITLPSKISAGIIGLAFEAFEALFRLFGMNDAAKDLEEFSVTDKLNGLINYIFDLPGKLLDGILSLFEGFSIYDALSAMGDFVTAVENQMRKLILSILPDPDSLLAKVIPDGLYEWAGTPVSEPKMVADASNQKMDNRVEPVEDGSKYADGTERRKPRSEMTAYERKMDRMDRTEERLSRANSTPQTSRGQELSDKSKENALSSCVSVNVVNAPTSQSVTNNSQSTAAIMDKNMPTVDYNDRTWAFG